MKCNDFYNLINSEVGASSYELVCDLVRLVTESSICILRGCIFDKKETTVPMEQVGAENEANSNLFVKDALMDHDRIMNELAWVNSSNGEVFGYNVSDGIGEAVNMFKVLRSVVVDEAIMSSFPILLLLMLIMVICLKFYVQVVRGNVFQVRRKMKWKEKISVFTRKAKQISDECSVVVSRRLIIQ
jgi:hypothetical protein